MIACSQYSGYIQEAWNLFDTVNIWGDKFVAVPTLEDQLSQFLKVNNQTDCTHGSCNFQLSFDPPS